MHGHDGVFMHLQVVASLYMARSDVAYTVRSAALHVWKTIVSNTPRTLGEILPALMKSIIASLASPGMIPLSSWYTDCLTISSLVTIFSVGECLKCIIAR